MHSAQSGSTSQAFQGHWSALPASPLSQIPNTPILHPVSLPHPNATLHQSHMSCMQFFFSFILYADLTSIVARPTFFHVTLFVHSVALTLELWSQFEIQRHTRPITCATATRLSVYHASGACGATTSLSYDYHYSRASRLGDRGCEPSGCHCEQCSFHDT